MLTLQVSPDAPDVPALREAADLLRRGGVIAYATDTLYGLAADSRQDSAIERLFAAKGRDERVALPLIAADLEQAKSVGVFGHTELRLATAFWPGPLTIVVPARPGLSPRVLAGGGTVAVRVPAHAVARALARRLGAPITSTSANRSGGPAVQAPADLDPALLERIDAVIDSGPAPGGAPSTIVQVAGGGVEQLRAGAIAWDRVLESVK